VRFVSHHADGLDRQEHRERLPELLAHSRVRDFLLHDGVGLADDREALLGDLAQHADGEPRPGNGCRETIASGKPSSRRARGLRP